MFGYPQIKSISQQNVQVFIFSHKKCWRLENVGRRMFLQPTWNLSLETTYKYLQWFFSLTTVFCLAQNRGINHETLLKLTNTFPLLLPPINKFYLVGWINQCKTQLQSLGAVCLSSLSDQATSISPSALFLAFSADTGQPVGDSFVLCSSWWVAPLMFNSLILSHTEDKSKTTDSVLLPMRTWVIT